MRRWLPFIGLLLLGVLLLLGLDPRRDPRLLPSALKGKPFPVAELPLLDGMSRQSTASFRGQPFVVNVFASWCPECVAENPVLLAFGRRSPIPLVGLAYKDEPAATTQWLARWGNPFDHVLVDADGRFGIELGVYGAPETYFVDAAGVVRARHVGALSTAQLAEYEAMIAP